MDTFRFIYSHPVLPSYYRHVQARSYASALRVHPAPDGYTITAYLLGPITQRWILLP